MNRRGSVPPQRTAGEKKDRGEDDDVDDLISANLRKKLRGSSIADRFRDAKMNLSSLIRLRPTLLVLMSTKHLEQVVQRGEILHDPALIDFLVRFVLALSTRILTHKEPNNQPTWPFAPFTESGICQFELPRCSVFTKQDTSHWTVDALAELPSGVMTLSASERHTLLVLLDFGLSKVRFQSPPTYVDTLHAISIDTYQQQPLGVYRLCCELGVWPSDFASVICTVSVPLPAVSKRDRAREAPLVTTVDESLRVTDLARIVVEYARSGLPGIVTYQKTYAAEYNNDQYYFHCRTWKIRKIAVEDASGHTWRFLIESPTCDVYNEHYIIRCADTGLLLSERRKVWCCLGGFIYHPISTNFALDTINISVYREDVNYMYQRLSFSTVRKFSTDKSNILKRLYSMQQRIAAAIALEHAPS
jgi:hypothetical protein